ncbi:MAG TPA: glucuronate isomerase [Clostridiales bacterium]|nr:glucuronate isomerase [Clostridiales bacterium]
MKEFMGRDFLLGSKTAEELYYGHAAKMPIFDFHCHLDPKEIYEDKKYRSLTEVWLGGDHYKWRLMREMGIPERLITGDAPDEEKFRAYASVMPYAVGNPIYAWTHLELRRFFGIEEILSPATADKIYAEANEKLKTLSARKMILESNVRTLCTTDDPADSLEYHIALQKDGDFPVRVLPAFRPDKALNIELSFFRPWLSRLEGAVGYKVDSYDKLKKALAERVDFFDRIGCVCSDHALDVVMYAPASDEELSEIFAKALKGETLSADELAEYKGNLLVYLGRLYHKKGWVQQYHIGALRNNSARNLAKLGPDTGFDAINDATFAPKLSALLSALDETDELPKTILYCLNPRDNEVLAAIINCFQGGMPGKLQFGSGWWFNDQKDGMGRQMEALMQVALISKFVGMLTDSRSFLSYTRHEYFRRILCTKLGALVENGEYPAGLDTLGEIVEDICYRNAEKFFAK